MLRAQEKFLSPASFATLDAGFVLLNCVSVSSPFLEQSWAEQAHVVGAGAWGRVEGLSALWAGKAQGNVFVSPTLLA